MQTGSFSDNLEIMPVKRKIILVPGVQQTQENVGGRWFWSRKSQNFLNKAFLSSEYYWCYSL